MDELKDKEKWFKLYLASIASGDTADNALYFADIALHKYNLAWRTGRRVRETPGKQKWIPKVS